MASDVADVSYRARLSAVVLAMQDAERAGRYGDVEALRLAEGVLQSLIREQAAATASAPVLGET